MLRTLLFLVLCAAATAAEVVLPPAPSPMHFDTDERDEEFSVRLDTDAGILILR